MYKENGSFFYDGAFIDFSEAAYSGVCLIIAIVFVAISLLVFCLSYIFNAWGGKKVCAIVFSIFSLLAGIFLLLGMLANVNSAFLMSVGMLSQLAALIAIPIGGIGLFVMGILAKRELFQKYGNFDLSYKICADWDWILRCLVNGATTTRVNTPIAVFSVGGASGIAGKKGLRPAVIYTSMPTGTHGGFTIGSSRAKLCKAQNCAAARKIYLHDRRK